MPKICFFGGEKNSQNIPQNDGVQDGGSTTVKVKVKTPNKQTQEKRMIFFGQALISRREAAMIFL